MGNILRPDSEKIRSLRVQRGWPQEQLARIADVSPRTIESVEAGDSASFETLRSVARAFELKVHDLMRQAPRLNAPAAVECIPSSPAPRPRDLPSPFLTCIPYLPIAKMALGSVALVLLASGAIRLSPYLLTYLEPETRVAASYLARGLSGISPTAAPARAATPAKSPSLGLQFRQPAQSGTCSTLSAPAPSTATAVSRLAEAPAAESHRTWGKADGQSLNGRIVFGALADLSSLMPRTGFHLPAHPVEAPGAPDPRLATFKGNQGLADRTAEDGISVSKPFVRSGKGAAALFAKFGSSIKRAF